MFKFNYLKKNYFLSSLKFLSLFGVLLLIVSCNSSEENSVTFFGGKIKNPRGNYVYVFKGDKVLDSSKLDARNKFSFHLDSIELGLYTFKHGPEFQYLYIEPNDSLLIYLDTWSFDESLIFSGKGSAKNNFLINLFVQQEEIEKKFIKKSFYNLNENEFSNKIDKEIKILSNQYSELILSEDTEPSNFYDELAKIAFTYPLYIKKEKYQLYHKNSDGIYDYPKVDQSFYNYRKNIDLNNEVLLGFWPYSLYLEAYFKNIAVQKELNDSSKNNFALNYMESVNQSTNNEQIRNKYISNAFWTSLSKDYCSKEERKKIEDYYFNNCTSEKFKQESKLALEQFYFLDKGDQMPDLNLINVRGNEVKLLDIIENKNSVIFFWPSMNEYSEKIVKNLPHLKEKHPHITFIGIERNKSNGQWEEFIVKNKLLKNNQFKFEKGSDLYSMYEGDWARTIIVNNKGNIINPFLFFNNSYELEKFLKKINNQ